MRNVSSLDVSQLETNVVSTDCWAGADADDTVPRPATSAAGKRAEACTHDA